jgi:hypothetical protein
MLHCEPRCTHVEWSNNNQNYATVANRGARGNATNARLAGALVSEYDNAAAGRHASVVFS